MDPTEQTTRQSIVRHDIADGCTLWLPAGYTLLSCAWHDGGAKLWVMADPEMPKVSRRVQMVSTGHVVLGDEWQFVGTITGEQKVWHVFVETE